MRPFSFGLVLTAAVAITACVPEAPPSVSEAAHSIKTATVEGAVTVKDATVEGTKAVVKGTAERIDDVVASITEKAEDVFSDDEKPEDEVQIEEKPAELSPSEFYGFDQSAIIARMGKPDFLRDDSNALILQYRTKNCVVDFVLMPNDDGKVEMSSWHGRHRTQGADFDELACRQDLAKRDKS